MWAGWAEVYKARDTRLGRDVAIKVLPAGLAGDPERRRRFEQEARAVSALNHPHICVLHDIGREGDTDYLVLEYLDGHTLADLLARKGRLSIQQTLDDAIQIAEALAAAHRQGIVHRDLKPENVMITKTGAKLLDFGLARLTEPVDGVGGTAAVSTIGTVFGTVPYMAPEQLQGTAVDARTDIFALGAVLYEMLTGRRAFEGDSPARVMAAILEYDPPSVASLQPLTPPVLDRLIRKCLAKDPEARWQSAADLADDLRWARQASIVPVAAARRSSRWHVRTALLAVAGLAMAAAGAGVMWFLRPVSRGAPVERVTVEVGPAEEMNAGGVGTDSSPAPGSRTALTWTPDARSLVFVGRRGGLQQLYVRALDAAEARALAGTEGAQVPAVSPDGQWVAFWAANALKKVRLAGGPVMDLVAEGDPPKGLAWGGQDRLFFGRVGAGIWQVSAAGVPSAVTTVGEAEQSHVLSSVLPGDRVLLFTVRKREWTWGDEEVVAFELASGQRKALVRDAADARYVPTGHLVFLRRGVLFAVPFDASQLKVTGSPVPVFEGVAQALVGQHVDNITGAGQFAISASGSLAWVPQGAVPRYHESVLVTVDRQGRVSELRSPVRSYAAGVRVSPDGRRLAVSVFEVTEGGVWLYDVARTALTPLQRAGEALSSPLFWSRDGQRVVFGWLHEGRFSLASQAVDADGSTPPKVFRVGGFRPTGWASSRDLIGVTGGDLAIASFENELGPIEPMLQTADVVEQWPEVSPDGHWLAYGSNASGRFDIYVQPYPGRARTLVAEGGSSPAWHPNGRELFYVVGVPAPVVGVPAPVVRAPAPVVRAPAPGMLRMMAVDFEPGSPPRIGRPRLLFEYERNLSFRCVPARCYDVAPDGQHFYVTRAQRVPTWPVVMKINLVLNWFEELKAKVPPAR